MKKTFVIISLFLAACQPNTAPPNDQTAKPSAAANALTNAAPINSNAANSPPPVSPAGNSDKSKVKTFDGKGVVTKINLELGSVALDHEEIKGLMPAMQGMEFYVSDKKMLDNLKVGDKVDFVLEDNAGAEQIIAIKKK